jgi:hypothetical protein
LDVDLTKDSFHVTYDPQRVTPERMLETVRAQGFRAEVAKGAPPAAAPATRAPRDLSRLPKSFQGAVRQARRGHKPLLLAFHGPG